MGWLPIKCMFDDLQPSVYERARREAAIQLHNDNLIEMIGFVETQELDVVGSVKKHYHVISELIEGVSLRDLLKGKTTDRYGKNVPYAVGLLHQYHSNPEHFARTVIMSVLNGLSALHNAGYIHRDIDPSNIMVTNSGQIKLIDFGLAKQMDMLAPRNKRLTVAGKFMGKPEYAAPELALGDIQRENQATDIYSVGILLYQCITGHRPFEGPRHEILQKQLKEKIPLNAIRNKNLRNVIAIACQKRQNLRYQSAPQMRMALEKAFLSGQDQTWIMKTILYAGGAIAAIVLAVIAIMPLMNEEEKNQISQPVELRSVEAACAKMKDPATAQQGLALLKELAEKDNDAHATYLLSRLYFRSRKADDFFPDSIRMMQQALNINIDNGLAHKLLRKTESLEPQNYFALYELGSDYMDGHDRNETVERDGKTALNKFILALKYATAAADSYYIERIQQKIDVYEKGL